MSSRIDPLVGADEPEDAFESYWDAAVDAAVEFAGLGLSPGIDGWLPFEVAAFEAVGLVPVGSAPADFVIPDTPEEYEEMKLGRAFVAEPSLAELVDIAVRAYFDKDQKRWPKGTPGGMGGQWMDEISAGHMADFLGGGMTAQDLLDNPELALRERQDPPFLGWDEGVTLRAIPDMAPSGERAEFTPATHPGSANADFQEALRGKAREKVRGSQSLKMLDRGFNGGRDWKIRRVQAVPTEGSTTDNMTVGAVTVDLEYLPKGWERNTQEGGGLTYDPALTTLAPGFRRPLGRMDAHNPLGAVTAEDLDAINKVTGKTGSTRWVVVSEREWDYAKARNDWIDLLEVEPHDVVGRAKKKPSDALISRGQGMRPSATGDVLVRYDSDLPVATAVEAPVERMFPDLITEAYEIRPAVAHPMKWAGHTNDVPPPGSPGAFEPVVWVGEDLKIGSWPVLRDEGDGQAAAEGGWVRDYALVPITDPERNLTAIQPSRGENAAIASAYAREERQRLAAEQAGGPHDGMKSRAMERIGGRIDMNDPDIALAGDVFQELSDWKSFAYGGDDAEQLAGRIVQEWARSASDSSVQSHYLHWAAQKEFDLPPLNSFIGGDGINPSDRELWDVLVGNPTGTAYPGELGGPGKGPEARRIAVMMSGNPASVEAGARKILRAIYDSTQEDLERIPGDELLLIRGMQHIEERINFGEVGLTPDAESWRGETADAAASVSTQAVGTRKVTPEERKAIIGYATSQRNYPVSAGVNVLLPSPTLKDGKRQKVTFNADADEISVVASMDARDAYKLLGYKPIGDDRQVNAWDEVITQRARKAYYPVRSAGRPSEEAWTRVNIADLLGQLSYSIKLDRSEGGEGTLDSAEARFREDARIRGIPSESLGIPAEDPDPRLLDAVMDATREVFAEQGYLTGRDDRPTAQALNDAFAQHLRYNNNGSVVWGQSQFGGSVVLTSSDTPLWLGSEPHVVESVNANPMTSTATSESVASSFEGEGGAMLAAIIPKADIIGMPGAGYGCLNENEMVVLGRDRPTYVVPHNAYTGSSLATRRIIEVLEAHKAGSGDPIRAWRSIMPLPVSGTEDPQIREWWNEQNQQARVMMGMDSPGGTIDLIGLSWWLDTHVPRLDDDPGVLSLTVLPNGIVRDENSQDAVQISLPPGITEIDPDYLQERLELLKTEGMFGDYFEFDVRAAPASQPAFTPDAVFDPWADPDVLGPESFLNVSTPPEFWLNSATDPDVQRAKWLAGDAGLNEEQERLLLNVMRAVTHSATDIDDTAVVGISDDRKFLRVWASPSYSWSSVTQLPLNDDVADELGALDKTEVDSQLRLAIQTLNKDTHAVGHYKAGIAYEPDQATDDISDVTLDPFTNSEWEKVLKTAQEMIKISVDNPSDLPEDVNQLGTLEQLLTVLGQGMKPGYHWTLNAPNVVVLMSNDGETMGDSYEIPKLYVPDQATLDSLYVLAVADPDDSGHLGDDQFHGPLYNQVQNILDSHAHVGNSSSPTAIEALIEIIGTYATDGERELVRASPSVIELTDPDGEIVMEFDVPGLMLASQEALDEIVGLLALIADEGALDEAMDEAEAGWAEGAPEAPFEMPGGQFAYAERNGVARGVINVDAGANEDWPKATWDLWGVDDAESLDAFIASGRDTPEGFMRLPLFRYNVEKLPWLKAWAARNTGPQGWEHPRMFFDKDQRRWPRGAPGGRGGRWIKGLGAGAVLRVPKGKGKRGRPRKPRWGDQHPTLGMGSNVWIVYQHDDLGVGHDRDTGEAFQLESDFARWFVVRADTREQIEFAYPRATRVEFSRAARKEEMTPVLGSGRKERTSAAEALDALREQEAKYDAAVARGVTGAPLTMIDKKLKRLQDEWYAAVEADAVGGGKKTPDELEAALIAEVEDFFGPDDVPKPKTRNVLKGKVDRLRAEMGDPISLSPVGLKAQKVREAVAPIVAQQTPEIVERLKGLDRIELTSSDVIAINTDVEPGKSTGLAGDYVRVPGGKWRREKKIGTYTGPDGTLKWDIETEGAGRGPGGLGDSLTDEEFATQYRGALRAALHLGPYAVLDEPVTHEQILAWIAPTEDPDTGWGGTRGRTYRVRDPEDPNSKGFLSDSLPPGIYINEPGSVYPFNTEFTGWHRYDSPGDFFGPGGVNQPGKEVYTADEIAEGLRGQWEADFKATRKYRITNQTNHEDLLDATVREAKNGSTDEYVRADGAPGVLYEQQLAKILEVGRVMDEELQGRMKNDVGMKAAAEALERIDVAFAELDPRTQNTVANDMKIRAMVEVERELSDMLRAVDTTYPSLYQGEIQKAGGRVVLPRGKDVPMVRFSDEVGKVYATAVRLKDREIALADRPAATELVHDDKVKAALIKKIKWESGFTGSGGNIPDDVAEQMLTNLWWEDNTQVSGGRLVRGVKPAPESGEAFRESLDRYRMQHNAWLPKPLTDIEVAWMMGNFMRTANDEITHMDNEYIKWNVDPDTLAGDNWEAFNVLAQQTTDRIEERVNASIEENHADEADAYKEALARWMELDPPLTEEGFWVEGRRKQALQHEIALTKRGILHDVIEDAGVELGGEPVKMSNSRRTQGVTSVNDAAEYFPTSWIRKANDDGRPLTVKLRKGKRAQYEYDGTLRTDGTVATSVHELMHHVEHSNKAVGMAEWTFWQDRARGGNMGATREKLSRVYQHVKKEVGVQDEFKMRYSGKVYNRGDPYESWELMSTGVPALWGLEYPEVTWEDPGYRRFVLGMLGVIR